MRSACSLMYVNRFVRRSYSDTIASIVPTSSLNRSSVGSPGTSADSVRKSHWYEIGLIPEK